MRGLLIRIGIDQAFGGWNAPADPDTGEFVYVPIPEKESTQFHAGCERPYRQVIPAVRRFAKARNGRDESDLGFPNGLRSRAMHLDPDFETLTYGDVGARRASVLRDFTRGDIVVFYASLRPTRHIIGAKLVYAIVGMFRVAEVVAASDVPEARWDENAHTRKMKFGDSDIVVRAEPEGSGRLRTYLDIGTWRDRAYRVHRELIDAWGGLSVKDGYIQRSARPPQLLDPAKFLRWMNSHDPQLCRENF